MWRSGTGVRHPTARGARFPWADGTLLGPLRDTVLTRHTDAGDGRGEGYGVHLYPDGRYGHGGGDPGVEVRDAMTAAWRG